MIGVEAAIAATLPQAQWNETFAPASLMRQQIDQASSRVRGIDALLSADYSESLQLEAPAIAARCETGGYRFSPYLEVLQQRGREKLPRVISVASARDRVVLAAMKEALHQSFPERVSRALPNQYVRSIKQLFGLGMKGTFLKLDIARCYDSIDHRLLLQLIEMRLPCSAVRLVERAIRTPTVPRGRSVGSRRLRSLGVGVPQGLAISNILAEIYLGAMDDDARALTDGYLRYVDDILVLGDDKTVSEVRTVLEEKLEGLKLSFAPEKERTGSIEEAFDYLGYRISLPNIGVIPSTLNRYLDSIAALFAKWRHGGDPRFKAPWLDRSGRVTAFLDVLNERITGAVSGNRRYGWLFYFLELTDLGVLSKIDQVVSSLCERYLRTRWPHGRKRALRAYWEARFNQLGRYVHNYNSYSTISEKLAFLVRRGHLNPSSPSAYAREQDELMFAQARDEYLVRLEADVGHVS